MIPLFLTPENKILHKIRIFEHARVQERESDRETQRARVEEGFPSHPRSNEGWQFSASIK